MSQTIQVGISTCPNDTFAFHALLNRKIDTGDIDFQFELLDVQELNQRVFAGEFEVAKTSFHAAVSLAEELAVLSSGSALGFGVGPLLLSAPHGKMPADIFEDNHGEKRMPVVGCPGKNTTATLLYRIFYPGCGEVRQMVFSELVPRLKSGEIDFGVCIHEGRFTFREEGLDCISDLGRLWESKTGLPLPLGGILVRKKIGDAMMQKVQSLVQKSIEYGLNHRQETLPTMKAHAQEFSEKVLFAHVDTYVNQWTIDLGDLGRESLEKLAELTAEMEGKTFVPFEIVTS